MLCVTVTTKFIEKFGATKQNLTTWKNGAVPEDDVIAKISEETGIDFLMLIAAAKGWATSGSAKTKTEWRKIFNKRKKELENKKGKTSRALTIKIKESKEKIKNGRSQNH